MIKLSAEQREAINQGKNTLIIAGPGSGKTTTLTALVANWAHRYNKNDCLALTFTNKAAGEMLERITDAVGETNIPQVTTFHAYAIRWLRRYHYRKLVIWDTSDAKAIWRKLCKGEKKFFKLFEIYEFGGNFRLLQEADIVATKCAQLSKGHEEAYWEIKDAYLAKMRNRGALDFNQMIQKFVDMYTLDDKRYRYLAIDEYQDTSFIQFDMIKALADLDAIVYAVGDGDQMLYHWRGANSENISSFIEEYNPVIVKLQDNYRSGSAICDVCNRLIGNNKKRIAKKTAPKRNFTGVISVRASRGEKDEARQVVGKLLNLHEKGGFAWSDMVVLVRNASLISPFLEEELRRNEIAHQIVSSFSFFGRKEVRSIIGLMKFIVNEMHIEGLVNFGQFYKLGITTKRMEKIKLPHTSTNVLLQLGNLKKHQAWQKNLAKIMHLIATSEDAEPSVKIGQMMHDLDCFNTLEVMDKEDETERKEHATTFIGEILSRYKTIEDALERICLSSERDVEKNGDYVKLMTIHAAKGLEWPVVFVLGLEEDVLPSGRSVAEDGDAESERRVFFVACSRAKNMLHLFHSKRRGYRRTLRKSRFLKEISDDD